MIIILLILSLLHTTTSTVYTVTPDDHYYHNITCHHCHNLQHYLLNITKYFTSNTQLLFLPGLHHLHTDLIIQNVHNISLIGSTANGTTLDTVIQCNSSVAMVMTNIVDLTMKNMVIKGCTNSLDGMYVATVTIKNCINAILSYLQIYPTFYGALCLLGKNILGESRFSYISCNQVCFIYNKIQAKNVSNTLLIDHLEQVGYVKGTFIELEMYQYSYEIAVQLAHITFQQQRSVFLYGRLQKCILSIMDCLFLSNRSPLIVLFKFSEITNDTVEIINCKFMNNVFLYSLVYTEYINVIVINCVFFNGNSTVLQLSGNPSHLNGKITVVIKNTQFVDSVILHDHRSSLAIMYANLLLEGIVIFQNITNHESIIQLLHGCTITIYGRVELSNNSGCQLIRFYYNNIQHIKIKEPSIISIHHNRVWSYFDTFPCEKILYPFCTFQYFSNKTSGQGNFSIMIYNNFYYEDNCSARQSQWSDSCNLPIISNCYWLSQSTFNNMIPNDVNNWFVKYHNNSIKMNDDHSMLCACNDQMERDCSINDLGYLYPGEALTLFLYHVNKEPNQCSTKVTVISDIGEPYTRPCVVVNFIEQSQLINNSYCSKLSYSALQFAYGEWCVLFLRVTDDDKRFLIRRLSCPPGFVEINKICECDPMIVNYGITKCDINNQTVLRPAKIWIIATVQIPYSYHITEYCPFHYCLPHSSHLNLSTPNSQCQFNRSGLLCGHCQQGLSTVFSSSQCQNCSNMYLLLITPIAISGILLVIMLFILNCTITDGTINGFILFVNIISINSSLIFSQVDGFTPAYTFISLANLDLGIQTCFYNGMDDYAKMWLQLAFPFYLIFIATFIIIASRYSIKVQRLTARRALPVLATLFLLSYTKILRIVSSVLFFYSTITHLPNKHTTLVWSVDANVPLFGVRFTILFIVCLVLFLILVPFNVILLFTRTLSRFRFINKFKPLLDAYQGPYKTKFYYWTGLQLLIRAILYGISSVDRNLNLTISIALFSLIEGIQGALKPFKITFKNFQEQLFLINLTVLYAFLLYNQDTNMMAVNIMITIAAIHFTIIIAYHIIIYMCSTTIKSKIKSSINLIIQKINVLQGKSVINQFELGDNMRCNIPEAVNYHEFRESLLNQY